VAEEKFEHGMSNFGRFADRTKRGIGEPERRRHGDKGRGRQGNKGKRDIGKNGVGDER
jgi:hypothetical protein